MPRRRNGFVYNNGEYNTYGYIDGNGIIILAAIESGGRYRTPGGNGIISNEREVKREFGGTNDIRWGPTYVYGHRGISFAYYSGLATSIAVFNQEGLRQLTTPIVPEDMSRVTIVR